MLASAAKCRFWNALSHPHIVRYYGGGEDDGTLFYIMELVDGGTVKGLLQIKGCHLIGQSLLR